MPLIGIFGLEGCSQWNSFRLDTGGANGQQRNLMTPLPGAESFVALNSRFLDSCPKSRQARLCRQAATIAESGCRLT